MNIWRAARPVLGLALVAGLLACGGSGDSGGEAAGGEEAALSGAVSIDGSSTVYPVTEAVAEEFNAVHPGVRVTVGVSGTGGGFKKFGAGETDINDASRPIKEKEATAASANGIEFIELPVAYDGLTVVVHPENDWVDHLTVAELHEIWKPGSTVQSWSQVRAGWPDRPIKLYGPGTDSGTFDYFTETVNGESQACRADFTASEDDNVLVQGVAGDLESLGFFGFAYYKENTNKLKAVPIDGGEGPVSPSLQTINDGSYQPLSRPIFIYVAAGALERPAVSAFIDFYLQNGGQLSQEVGYVALPDEVYSLAQQRVAQRVTGSVYHGDHGDKPLVELFAVDSH